jgi:hypothetical protein
MYPSLRRKGNWRQPRTSSGSAPRLLSRTHQVRWCMHAVFHICCASCRVYTALTRVSFSAFYLLRTSFLHSSDHPPSRRHYRPREVERARGRREDVTTTTTKLISVHNSNKHYNCSHACTAIRALETWSGWANVINQPILLRLLAVSICVVAVLIIIARFAMQILAIFVRFKMLGTDRVFFCFGEMDNLHPGFAWYKSIDLNQKASSFQPVRWSLKSSSFQFADMIFSRFGPSSWQYTILS